MLLGRHLKEGQLASSPINFRTISDWMTLSAKYRKSRSHYGAIRCFEGTHPCHYLCPLLGPTFDPGNHVYAMVLKIVVPELNAEDWNNETLGDIAEGLLATGLRWDAPPPSLAVALWLEVAAGLMYSVTCYFPAYNTQEEVVALIDRARLLKFQSNVLKCQSRQLKFQPEKTFSKQEQLFTSNIFVPTNCVIRQGSW